MKCRSPRSLADHVLISEFEILLQDDRRTTATLLAYLAEIDCRRLHLPAGHPSLFAYCVEHFGMSEDIAFKRIRVARAARRHPAILPAIAEGRLGLTTVLMLTAHLTEATADELRVGAMRKTNAEVARLLAERFPRPDLPSHVEPLLAAQLAARPVKAPRAKLAPLAPQRFGLQVTIGQGTHDKLRRAQELLGHAVPPNDLEQVLDRALEALIESSRSASSRRATGRGRTPSGGAGTRGTSRPT